MAKNVHFHLPRDVVPSSDRTWYCPIHQLCFHVFPWPLHHWGNVSANSIHTCDNCKQTSSLNRHQFSPFLQASYFAAFMLHESYAGSLGTEQSMWLWTDIFNSGLYSLKNFLKFTGLNPWEGTCCVLMWGSCFKNPCKRLFQLISNS